MQEVRPRRGLRRDATVQDVGTRPRGSNAPWRRQLCSRPVVFKTVVLGGEVGALGPGGARADSGEADRSHFEPLRSSPERCLPADSLLPHIPAHEAGGPPSRTGFMSTPISPISISAVRRCTPAMVLAVHLSSKGAITRSISAERVPDSLVEELQVREDRSPRSGRWGPNLPVRASFRAGIFRRSFFPGRVRERISGSGPSHQGGQHVPARGAQDVGGNGGELDPRALQDLSRRWISRVRSSIVGLCGTGSGCGAPGWASAARRRPDQAVLGELADPLGVPDVGPCARGRAKVPGVQHPALRARPPSTWYTGRQ